MSVINSRESLVALPNGTRMIDREGYVVEKWSDNDYRVTSPEDGIPTVFDSYEIAGEYDRDENESAFLFFPLTVIGGDV